MHIKCSRENKKKKELYIVKNVLFTLAITVGILNIRLKFIFLICYYTNLLLIYLCINV